MPIIARTANSLLAILSAETGLPSSLSRLAADYAVSPVSACSIRGLNLSVDLSERAPSQYPALFVYCERMTNSLREKFSTFSGTAQMVIEVRVSASSPAELDIRSSLYTEAVLDVLNLHRGEWATGVHYGGGYDVAFQPVRRGGDNYLQISRISVPVQLHIS
jgi:hypothetical protein